jgi:hypothetical protein
MDLEWLKKIHYGDEGKYLFLKEPVSISLMDKQYVVVSDGHLLVAIESADASFPKEDKSELAVKKVMAFQGLEPKIVDLANLKTWLGPAEWDSPCSTCNGNGSMPPCKECGHEALCAKCDGEGGKFSEQRFGKLFSVFLDCNLLARGLQGFSDEKIKLYISGAETQMYFIGADWIVCLMPCKVYEEESSYPLFAEELCA